METKAAGSLTHGRLGKQILAFSLPLMLSNVLQVLFNMSDIAVVGRFSGPIALGAVGSTATLVTLFTGFLIGLGSGINALVARFLGAGSREETQRTVHTALALSLIFGAVLLLLGELTAVPLLKLLGTKEELIDGATIYLRIYFLGMPAMALYNFGNAVLSAADDTRRPLLYLLIAGILNVALNLFFVIVCGMSADGVALASILTQYLSSVLILIALVRTQDAYGVRPKCIRLHRDKLAPLLTLCCSAGLQNAIFAVANLFIQAGVNRFDALIVKYSDQSASLVRRLKSIGDKSRLEILRAVKDGPCNGQDIAEKLSLAPATISHHMNLLCNEGLLTATRRGTSLYYEPDCENLSRFLRELEHYLL